MRARYILLDDVVDICAFDYPLKMRQPVSKEHLGHVAYSRKVGPVEKQPTSLDRGPGIGLTDFHGDQNYSWFH